jgi:hypothetical protein
MPSLAKNETQMAAEKGKNTLVTSQGKQFQMPRFRLDMQGRSVYSPYAFFKRLVVSIGCYGSRLGDAEICIYGE